jgi:hypothetical protein
LEHDEKIKTRTDDPCRPAEDVLSYG